MLHACMERGGGSKGMSASEAEGTSTWIGQGVRAGGSVGCSTTRSVGWILDLGDKPYEE
jgi:hypothetical protein